MTAMFKKYTAGVYCVQSDQALTHGEKITVPTRRGKEVEVVIWKHLFARNGVHYHSYLRSDGFCSREKHLRNAQVYEQRSEKKRELSAQAYEKSREHADFLSLGEPIKIGHHSEKRHRRIIESANRNMGKSVELEREAEHLVDRAKGAELAAEQIFMDRPECIEQLMVKLEQLEEEKAQAKRDGAGPVILGNRNAKLRNCRKKLETARTLWELPEPHSET